MQEEQREEGAISPATYDVYVGAAGGYLACGFVVILFLLAEGVRVFNYWWLAVWLGAGDGNPVSSLISTSVWELMKDFCSELVSTKMQL